MSSSSRSQIITLLVMAIVVFLFIFYYFAQQIIKVQHWLQDAGRIQNRIQELPPFTMPELIRGHEAEEMALDYLQLTSWTEFYRIPDSSTLYLNFSNFNIPEELHKQSAPPFIQSTTNVTESVALIDLEDPSQSVFTTLFRTQMNSPLGGHSFSREHEITTHSACLLNGVPTAIFYSRGNHPSDEELADPQYNGRSYWATSSGSYIALDAAGFREIKRRSKSNEFFWPMQSVPFLFDHNYPFRLMEIERFSLRERYVILDPNKQTQYWQQGRLSHLEFQALREDLVFGSNRKHTKIAFYTTQPQPVIREFEAKELFDLLPIQPEDLTLEYYQSIYSSRPLITQVTTIAANIPKRIQNLDPAKFQWQYWHKEPLRLQPLSRGNDSSLLVQLIMPSNPILRIHIDRIATGTLSEIVEFIGNCDTHTAQKAFDNDRIIVFHPNPFESTIHSEPQQSAYNYSIACLQENGRLGPLENIAGSLPLDPTEFIHISRLPYDDEHFLIEGNNAFYTLRWDGVESKRVFPR